MWRDKFLFYFVCFDIFCFSPDNAIADYLFANCKKETLEDLCNVMESGIITQECPINDIFLLLYKMVDNKKFNNLIENITQMCLSTYNNDKNKIVILKIIIILKIIC